MIRVCRGPLPLRLPRRLSSYHSAARCPGIVSSFTADFEYSTPSVRIAPLAKEQLLEATQLLVESFSDRLERRARLHVEQGLSSQMASFPHTACFVATQPAGGIVGIVTLALNSDYRPPFRGPTPLDDDGYVANMAVLPRERRKGLGRALLSACSAAASAAGRLGVSLHVLAGDAPAMGLYRACGYAEIAREFSMFGLGADSKLVLMRRSFD